MIQEETRRRADDLVDKMQQTDYCGIKHFPTAKYCDCTDINPFQARMCAIESTKNTIEVLEKVFNKQEGTKDIYSVAYYILDQNEILKELESRI